MKRVVIEVHKGCVVDIMVEKPCDDLLIVVDDQDCNEVEAYPPEVNPERVQRAFKKLMQ